MDSYTKSVFDKIVAKDVSGLLPGDVTFLRARKSYLNKKQLEKFAKIFKEDKEEK